MSFPRRDFLGLCLSALLLAGCGSSSNDGPAGYRLNNGQTAALGNHGPSVPGTGPGNGVPVPFNPVEQTQVLYVTESDGGTLGIYDATTYQLLDRIPVGDDPSGLSFDTQRQRILVALLDGSALSLDADNPDATPLSTVALPPSSFNLIYDPGIDAVWVSSFSQAEKLAALSAETLAHLSGSPLTDPELLASATLALDPNGDRLYVTQTLLGSAAVSVIDTATRTLLYHITTMDTGGDQNEGADGLAYHPAYDHLYVGNTDVDTADDDSLVVLDASQEPPAIIQRVHSGMGPTSIAVDLEHNRVYATNFNSPTGGLSVYSVADTSTPLTFLQTLPTDAQPLTVIYDDARNRILVTNFQGDTISVFDADTLAELPGSPFAMGDGPNFLMLRPTAAP